MKAFCAELLKFSNILVSPQHRQCTDAEVTHVYSRLKINVVQKYNLPFLVMNTPKLIESKLRILI